jgi:hypothetical protein
MSNSRDLAARFAPELCMIVLPPDRGGRRECRVKASPMARLQQRKQAAVTTGSARSSGIPCAMALRLIRALLGAPGFLATVCATTRKHVAHGYQRRGIRTTRFRRPRCVVRPCMRHTLRHIASTASHLACRDDRETPLLSRRDAPTETQFLERRKRNFPARRARSGDRIVSTRKMSFSARAIAAQIWDWRRHRRCGHRGRFARRSAPELAWE